MSRSSFVENPMVVDDVLHGTIIVLGQAIEASFDPSNDDDDDDDDDEDDAADTDVDTDTVVQWAEAVVARLTADALATIVEHVANEVTDAAFSQSDVDADHVAEALEALRVALQLVRMDFWPEGTMLVFVAPAIFVGQEIFAQLDEDLAVVDIAVHDDG